VHVVTRSRLVSFWRRHSDAEHPLRVWYRLTSRAQWRHFVQLREAFPAADQVGRLVVFNVGGNKYRLIAFVDYISRIVFIRNVLTHADYLRGGWKDDQWF